ncbi:MAG TPA: hypothetical protein VJV78_05850 [Polyangiales bacterium]|nr:hypothetical protein [Polyangiales bacterium]
MFALILAGLHPVDNPDSFGHLAAGRQIVELGHVPALDTFSYFRATPQPWVNYEWLSDLLLYAGLSMGGFGALNLWKLAILATTGGLLVWIAYARARQLGARLCALVLVMAVPAARFRLSVRPHMFGLLLSALYWIGLLRILESAESSDPARRAELKRWLIALGALHVVWVNLHGSHLLGLLLTLIACSVSARRPAARTPLLGLLGLELIASCISPYGPEIVIGAIEHVFDPRYRRIVSEWQPWSPAQPQWFLLGVLLQALLLALAWRGLPRTPAGRFMRLCGLLLFVMAARSMRFISDFLLLGSPLVAEGLARGLRWLRATRRLPQLPAAASLGAWLVALAAVSGSAFQLSLSLPPYAEFGLGVDTRTLPAGSGAWLARHRPEARVFAAMEDSWYLMFATPRAKVLMDGRVPFYGPEHMFAMFRAWLDGASLQRTIAQTHTDVVIVQPALAEHQTALRSMLAARDFQLVLLENKHALFVKDTTLPGIRALVPGYDAQWLLAASADVPAIRGELARLRVEPNAGLYVAWIDALLALRPLARAEGRAGFAPPSSRSELAMARRALELLRPLRAVLEDVPSLSAYRALAAVLACELGEAERVLDDVRDEDASRETVFARQELHLRRGQLAEVRAFIDKARAVPEAAGDAWLASLTAALVSPPRCD